MLSASVGLVKLTNVCGARPSAHKARAATEDQDGGHSDPQSQPLQSSIAVDCSVLRQG